MPERQVSLQELESKLDGYIHDVENGATVVVSRDGRQVARIIPETDSAEQKRAALKASGTFDWNGHQLRTYALMLVCLDPTLAPADPRPDLRRIANRRPRPLASAGGDIASSTRAPRSTFTSA